MWENNVKGEFLEAILSDFCYKALQCCDVFPPREPSQAVKEVCGAGNYIYFVVL